MSLSLVVLKKVRTYLADKKKQKAKRDFEKTVPSETVKSARTIGSFLTGDRVCIYSSFDGDGVLHAYVLEQLKYYRDKGFKIVFVTSSPQISDADQFLLAEVCTAVVLRRNFGYDFCSWKVGFEFLPKSLDWSQLLLTNDSVFGPFTDFLKDLVANRNQVIGLTDSFVSAHHLQSYFLLFGTDVVNSKIFRDFMASIVVLYEKWDIITRFEIGLTKALKGSFVLTPLFSYKECFLKYSQRDDYEHRSRNDELLNPTEFFWDFLLSDGFPFLKRYLLSVNYPRSKKVNRWFQWVPNEQQRALISDYIEKKGIQILY